MKPSSLLNYSGSTLIEIMLSLFLSILLITALITHYVFAKKEYFQVEHGLEHVLEMQFIEDLFRDSIRKAGFTPCVNLDRLVTKEAGNETRLTSIKVNFGKYQALETYRMSEYFDQVLDIPAANQLLITEENSYKKSQSILIADCYHAEVQQIAYVHHHGKQNLVVLEQALRFNYDPPIYVGEWIEESFFVKQNQSKHSALYYKKDHAEELTPHVKKLSTNLFTHHGKTLVKVILATNGQSLVIDTLVRSR